MEEQNIAIIVDEAPPATVDKVKVHADEVRRGVGIGVAVVGVVCVKGWA